MSKAAQGAKSPTGPTSRSTRANRSSRGGGAGRTARSATSTTSTTDTKKEAATTAAAATSTETSTDTSGPATSAPDKAAPDKTTAAKTSPAKTVAAGAATPAARRGSGEDGPSPVHRLGTWLRRVPGWWPLPLCLALGATGGVVYSAMSSPQYAAISYVVVSPSGRSEAAAALGYAQAYGKVATDPVVLAEAEDKADLRRGTLSDTIQASTSPDAPMVQITATSARPGQAAKNADAVAKALASTAKASVKRTGARLTVLSDSVAPATPVSPSSTVAVAVGGCAGGLIGGLVLLARPQRGRRETGPAETGSVTGNVTGNVIGNSRTEPAR
ncbi:MAG TPA: hypothetical protein VNS49_07655 [Streptomyces sp.]|nr:hypothetical protein [Streptomyces sp.]